MSKIHVYNIIEVHFDELEEKIEYINTTDLTIEFIVQNDPQMVKLVCARKR